jgi:threonine dehydratase
VDEAHRAIKPHLKYTRVVKWKRSNLFLKMESEQVTGSFKARGGGYKVLSMNKSQRAKGATTASTGNHGAGVAHMSKCLDVPLSVYVPKDANEVKLAKIRGAGA